MVAAQQSAESRIMRSAKTLFYWLALISGVIIAVMAVHTASDVVLRNITNQPIPGTLNYVTYWWMPLLVFLVLAYAHISDQHLTVSLATEGATGRTYNFAKIFARVISLVVLFTLCYFMLTTATDSFSRTETIVSDIRLEIWGIRIVAAIGMIAYTVATVLSLVEDLRGVRDSKQEDVAPQAETGQIADV